MTAVPQGATVLVYSNSAEVRAQVRTAVGRRPAPDTGRIEWVECAAQADVQRELDQGGIDVAILDGEAVPAGGMGIARQLKDEIYRCPPLLVLTGRIDDAWLATWSRAEAVVPHPIDPLVLADVFVRLMRGAATQATQ